MMGDISLGIHPRYQSTRKQFAQQQIKYFYNSTIFSERPSEYDPSKFQKNTIEKPKTISSPPISPKKSIVSIASENIDIITGLPISNNRNFEKSRLTSRKNQIKTETDVTLNTQTKETKNQSPLHVRLYFDNKKQYELWLKQNKEYEQNSYFEKPVKLQGQSPQSSNRTNSYFQLHGKITSQQQK